MTKSVCCCAAICFIIFENQTAFGQLNKDWRGERYCEVLLIYRQGFSLEAQVWGTPGLNECPEESWEALEPSQIRSENNALAVYLNGPRFMLMNSVSGDVQQNETKMFGEIEMRHIANVRIRVRDGVRPFREKTVDRSTTFVFNKGEEVYQLTSPDGAEYVMQSFAQIVDSELSLDDLPSLGERLNLPEGWTYRAVTLKQDLVLEAAGQAKVIQDNLRNTYQKK